MEVKKIFVGTIRKCTKIDEDTLTNAEEDEKVNSKSIIYKRNAILLEVSKKLYVDYDFFETLDDLRKVIHCVNNNISLDGVILGTFGTYVGCLFVDQRSLKNLDNLENILDVRIINNIKNSKKTTC